MNDEEFDEMLEKSSLGAPRVKRALRELLDGPVSGADRIAIKDALDTIVSRSSPHICGRTPPKRTETESVGVSCSEVRRP
ncbi:hypothetical protein [Streptomyces niveus]|uniref:hypothetical protein n=1 Tax=Streptomyces niveus TaxID=193462 RepID=UPI00342473E3